MRVNVYHEELTKVVKCAKGKAKTGAEYYGLRLYLRSPKSLHSRPGDDDRSAVILWAKDRERLLTLLAKAMDAVKKSK